MCDSKRRRNAQLPLWLKWERDLEPSWLIYIRKESLMSTEYRHHNSSSTCQIYIKQHKAGNCLIVSVFGDAINFAMIRFEVIQFSVLRLVWRFLTDALLFLSIVAFNINVTIQIVRLLHPYSHIHLIHCYSNYYNTLSDKSSLYNMLIMLFVSTVLEVAFLWTVFFSLSVNTVNKFPVM